MTEATPENLGGTPFGGDVRGQAVGGRRLDDSLERLESTLDKFSDTLQRLISSLETQAKAQSSGRGTQQSQSVSGIGGNFSFPWQPTGGSHRAEGPAQVRGGGGYTGSHIGGNFTFGGVTGGAHRAPGPPVTTGGGAPGQHTGPSRTAQMYQDAGGATGVLGFAGKAAFAAGTIYSVNHYGSQVAGQTLAATYAGSQDWRTAHRNMLTGNYTAASDQDALQSASMLAQYGGYMHDSAGYQAQKTGVQMATINPAFTQQQATSAMLSMQSVGATNRGMGHGLDFTGKNIDQIANMMLRRIPGHERVKTMDQVAAAMHPRGSVTVTLMSAVSAGVLTPEAEPLVRDKIREILTAQVHGASFQEYQQATKDASSGTSNATRDRGESARVGMGLPATAIAKQRESQGLRRDTEATTIGGFTDALFATTGVLDQFRAALNQILEGPLGYVVGAAGGAGGTLGASGGSTVTRFMQGYGTTSDGPPSMSSAAMMYSGGSIYTGGGDGPSNLSSASAVFAGSGGGGGVSAKPVAGGGGSSGGASSGSANSAGSKYNLGPVKPWVAAAANHLGPKFGITSIGGYRPTSAVSNSDHPRGLALDLMCGKSAGDKLAAYAKDNHKQLNITYIIWRQRIWSINNRSWKLMDDRGSATANHYDHVHISFLASPSNPDLGGLSGGGMGSGTKRGSAGGQDIGGSQFTSSGMGGATEAYGGQFSEVAALGLGGLGGGGAAGAEEASSGGGGRGGSSGGGGGGGAARIVTANMNWARGRDEQYLAHLAETADVLLIQEANDINLDRLLPKGWKSNQNLSTAGKMGSAIAWNSRRLGNSIGTGGLAFGATQTQKDGSGAANTRYLSFIDANLGGQRVRLISGHFPLRSQGSQSGFEQNLKELINNRPNGSEWLLGTDANQSLTSLARRLGGVAKGVGIRGQIMSRGLKAGGMSVDDWGVDRGMTDHPAIGLGIRDVTKGKGGQGGDPAANIRLGRALAASRGWKGDQWAALQALWQSESGWRTGADNPSSSAYGIPQALLSAHNVPKGFYDRITGSGRSIHAYGGDPKVQIQWGLNYIKDRYGSPESAWEFKRKNNWYAIGEWNIRDDKDARVHKGEMILPSKVAEAVRNELTAPGIRGGGGGGPVITFQPNSIVVQLASGMNESDGRKIGKSIVDAIAEDNRLTTLAKGR